MHSSFMHDMAAHAGKVMLKHFRIGMEQQQKSDMTPVTKADLEINDLLIKNVCEHFPKHDVLAEEKSSRKNRGRFLWVCDPVDGTIPYAHGIPVAMFSLALLDNGSPVAAITHDPFLNRTFYAEKGKGALLNGKPIKVGESYCIGTTEWMRMSYDTSRLNDALIQKDYQVLDPSSFVYMGCLVACGTFAAAIFAGDTAHDLAAVKLIVEEAGGTVTDIFGEEQRYDSTLKGAIASNGIIHEELVGLSRDLVTPGKHRNL